MKQYFDLLKENKEYILLFQVGEFYELFDQQAKEIAKMIGLTLTKKNDFDMCGIPVHQIDFYIKKLVKEYDQRIAICDQTETPIEAKQRGSSLVNRSVTKKVTPGTYNDNLSYENNFVLCIQSHNNTKFTLCYGDISTEECFIEEVNDLYLQSTIKKINPTEILCTKELSKLIIQFDEIITIIDSNNDCVLKLKEYFQECGYRFDCIIKKINNSSFIHCTSSTIKNLEIFQDSSGKTQNSLCKILNKCSTPMGKRLFIQMLSKPLSHKYDIEQRHDCVDYFLKQYHSNGLWKLNSNDLEKTCKNILEKFKNNNRLSLIYELATNIVKCLEYKDRIDDNSPNLLKILKNKIGSITCHKIILNSINKTENEIQIKDDNIKKLIDNKKQIIHRINQYGESYLCKVIQYKITGKYVLEANNKTKVPENFIMERSLANSTRYTTKEIIQYESELTKVQSEIDNYEHQLIQQLIINIQNDLENIKKLCELVAHMDCFQAFAISALYYNYVRPKIVESQTLKITEGRHPIIEQKKTIFIHNNTNLDNKVPIYIITGPNMGGKSTYLRQNALIIWMNQVGLFVPAASAELGVFKQIAVRIGAGDNISENQSTFMVEMHECNEICQLTNDQSILFLDELGRGTSAKEGAAILSSMIKYVEKRQSLAMFATHYHEVPDKFNTNYSKRVSINIQGNSITLLYKIENGKFKDSFARAVIEKLQMPKEILIEYDKYIE